MTTSPFSINSFNPNRIVIKLGTQLLIDSEGQLNKPRLVALVGQIATLVKQGKAVLLVSSGAVGLGKEQVQTLAGKTLSLNEKQACAAIGQSMLMETYRELFALYKLQTAQILVTAENFAHRQQYLNLQQTLEQLLNWGIIPILNENDVVSTLELEQQGQEKGFGDNDKLSALIASKLSADLLIILTNVNGIYTDNPTINPDAQPIPVIEGIKALNDINRHITVQGTSDGGRGGMKTKLEAARIAAISGVHTCIVNGQEPLVIERIFNSSTPLSGTWILPSSELNGKKRWIGLASGFQGKVLINAGAKLALLQKQASLLPVGIIGVEGNFTVDQVVSLLDENGNDVGRGIVNFSANQLNQFKGLASEAIAQLTGHPQQSGRETVAIYRENLVLFESCY